MASCFGRFRYIPASEIMRETVKNEPIEEKKATVKPQREKKTWGANIVPAFVLIFVGLLFLANNLGIVPWYIWGELWRFWPLFLILLGIQYLLGRSGISRIVMAILTILVLAFLLLYALSSAGFLKGEEWKPFQTLAPHVREQSEDRVVISSREFTDVTSREIHIDAGLGKLLVEDGNTDDYYSLTADYPSTFSQPKVETKLENKALVIKTSVPGSGSFHGIPMRGERLEYNALIGRRELPTSVALKIGAGTAGLRFTDLLLQNISLEVGMGSSDISLTEKSLPQKELRLEVGMGSISLELPKSVGVLIDYEVGLGSVSIDGESLRGDGTYRSENYESAERHINISAQVGTGSLTLIRD